jgi:hypothetical protein
VAAKKVAAKKVAAKKVAAKKVAAKKVAAKARTAGGEGPLRVMWRMRVMIGLARLHP